MTSYEDGLVLVLPDADDREDNAAVTPVSEDLRGAAAFGKMGRPAGINNVADLNNAHYTAAVQPADAGHRGPAGEPNLGYRAEITDRGDVKFVMIAGPSSSGKTTFSRRLSIQLRAHGLTPHPLSLDDFYRTGPVLSKRRKRGIAISSVWKPWTWI